MLKITTRAAILGSVAALSFSAAHAQNEAPGAAANPEACVALADRLASDSALDQTLRTDVEGIIATGDVARCDIVIAAWEEQGSLTAESLTLVTTEQATQRVIVQQEVEVSAEAAVYQPPVEVDVDTGAPEVVWSMPRQSVTVEEQAPQVLVSQGQPRIAVEMPQPRVTVMIPEPVVTVIWPESSVDMSAVEPQIEVRIPDPVVSVDIPDPIIEMTIGGAAPADLVELADGRFAPAGATAEDLEPRINVRGQEAVVSATQEAEDAEIVFNRAEPVVAYESQEPEVTVNVVGEPQIEIVTANEAEGTEETEAGEATPGQN